MSPSSDRRVRIETSVVSAVNRPWPPAGTVPAFSIDFNRHGKLPTGNGYLSPSLNMLYSDGHSSFVSAREAYRAIRGT